MKIAIGCDELAVDLKNALIEVIKEKGVEYERAPSVQFLKYCYGIT